MAGVAQKNDVDEFFSKVKTTGLISNPSEEYKKKFASATLAIMKNDKFTEEFPNIMRDFIEILKKMTLCRPVSSHSINSANTE